jgi:hypothetical protein
LVEWGAQMNYINVDSIFNFKVTPSQFQRLNKNKMISGWADKILQMTGSAVNLETEPALADGSTGLSSASADLWYWAELC